MDPSRGSRRRPARKAPAAEPSSNAAPKRCLKREAPDVGNELTGRIYGYGAQPLQQTQKQLYPPLDPRAKYLFNANTNRPAVFIAGRSSSSSRTSTMADPFEVRMRFTNHLRQLNASVTSAQKAAQYALKYREQGEDLHSCILEQLERSNMNIRANIMYFIEHFLETAHREGHGEYVTMMARDIIRVVDAVAPEDGSGAANVKVARKVIKALHVKRFLDDETVSQIEEVLRDRYQTAQDLALMPSVSPPEDGLPHSDNLGDMPPPRTRITPKTKGWPPPKLDRKQVEQRIEEDRERHKRQREGTWAVSQENDGEFNRLWEETSALGDDDERMGQEDYEEWKEQALAKCVHKTANANGKH